MNLGNDSRAVAVWSLQDSGRRSGSSAISFPSLIPGCFFRVNHVSKNARPERQGAAPAEQPVRLARGLVDVGSLIGRLTRPVLGNRGFAGADVIAHWPTIVGAELAALACPLSLKYERKNQRHGATLMVRVASGAAATLLQFKGPQVIERVNRYFGYQAVAKLQISLGPLPKTAKAPYRDQPDLPAAHRAEIDQAVEDVDSPALRLALGQLGAALRRRTITADEE